ncbi:hypothetical protein BHL21_18760 [Bacillus cereus]|uniref:toxin-antitoxin system YwqK family antitoxin n=1 Tax=Bacillus cereus TaxID=1396 RepID=UPI000994D335|nr:hypothetical protein [Bacillus cereus]OPA14913.1 hypothetical protein BHL21_18760 [Bacillus cereus]
MFWKKEKNTDENRVGWIILGAIIPLLVAIIVLYLVFGNLVDAFQKMFELRGEPNKTKDAVASLSSVLTLTLTVYGIIITAYFSFLVWKVSKSSFQVSEDLKILEENRDKEAIREQALIVYYDLQRGFSYLRDLYISIVLQKGQANPKRLFFSEEWIKNVATLRNGLSNEDLEAIYRIYNDFLTLQGLLESQSEKQEELSSFIEGLAKKIYAEFLPTPILDKVNFPPAEELINVDLYIVLQKIYLLTFPETKITTNEAEDGSFEIKVNGVNFYRGKSKDIWNAEGVLYNSNGNRKCEGFFAEGIFMTGKYYGYLNTVSQLYVIEYETTSAKRKITYGEIGNPCGSEEIMYYYKGKYQEGMVIEGNTTKFHSNGAVSYIGEVVNGEKHGQGTSFTEDGKIYFKGTYTNNLRVSGTLYEKGKEIFKGEFKEGRPWDGAVKNYHFNGGEICNFSGELSEGKPHNGIGLVFKQNQYGQTWYEINGDIEGMSEMEEDYFSEEYKSFNDSIRRSFIEWDEYLYADWKDGKSVSREDKEENIKVFGYR